MATVRIATESPDGEVWIGDYFESTYTPEMHWLAQGASGYARIRVYEVHDADGNTLARWKRNGHRLGHPHFEREI